MVPPCLDSLCTILSDGSWSWRWRRFAHVSPMQGNICRAGSICGTSETWLSGKYYVDNFWLGLMYVGRKAQPSSAWPLTRLSNHPHDFSIPVLLWIGFIIWHPSLNPDSHPTYLCLLTAAWLQFQKFLIISCVLSDTHPILANITSFRLHPKSGWKFQAW